MFSSNARAATYTWQDGAIDPWTDASRWSGGPAGTVPGDGDTAIINNGQVRLASNVTVGTLNWGGGRISDVSGNTVTARLIVTTALNISGTTTKYLATDSQTGNFAIENHGTATWTGTGDVGTAQFSGATGKMEFYNLGNFNIQNDEFFSADFINSSGATMTKQSGSGTSNFTRPLHNDGAAKVQSGVLSLSNGGDIGNGSSYDCSAGATLALSGTHTLASGSTTLSGVGPINLGGSGSLSLSVGAIANVTGNLQSFGGISGGQLKVTGTLDWMGGTMQGGATVIEAAGKLNIKGSGSLDNGHILNNSGTATWTNGSLSAINGATFNNKSGGKFNIQNVNANFNGGFNGAVFNNETGGLVTQTGASIVAFTPTFNNNGTVDVQGGALELDGGGTSAGTFQTASGARTVFHSSGSQQSFTHSSGTSFSGAGDVSNSGSVNIAPGATVNCDANYSLQDFSTLKLNLASVFNAKKKFDLRGGTLDGSGVLNISGKATWFDGTMQGTGGETNILAGGQIEINSSDTTNGSIPNHTLDTRNINNNGTFTIQGSSSFGDLFDMTNGANFNNKSGAIVNIVNDGYFFNKNSSGGTFDNQAGAAINCNVISGDFLKGGGIDVTFINNGTVNVQGGTFYVAGGGNGVGKFNVTGFTTLVFDIDNYIANAGTTLVGGGTTFVDGTITIPSNANLIVPAGHTFRLGGGLDGAGSLTVNGMLDWQEGAMLGGGITTISAGASATFSTGEFDQSKDLTNRTINNNGTITWSGDNIVMGNGATINNKNGANFIVNTDRSMGISDSANPQAIFNNLSGSIFTKSGGTGTQIWQAPFANVGIVNLQSGTLNFQYFSGSYSQTGGFTILNGGNLSSVQFTGNKSTIDIQGGIVTGIGTINADLNNNGRIQPGQTAGVPGVLAISGNYTQTANGKLDIEIGGTTPGTQYDQLQTGGNAALDGLLNIIHLNNFTPSLGDAFLALTYASRSGSFSLSGTDYGVLLLKPIYNATDLTLVTQQRTIKIDNEFILEDTGAAVTATFTVFLSDASGQSVTVDFATTNGSATAPADYVAQSGSITFSPGQRSKTISIAVQGDSLDEDDENFFVNLSGAAGALLDDAQGECTIVDNDSPPALSIRDLSVAEGASGFTNAAFTVVLSAASGKEIKVNYASIDGSALAPADYTAVSGTLVFAVGTTLKTISVPIKGDLLDELNETFRINLSSPVNATIADNQALGTIRDDDPTPALSINSVTIVEGNSGTKDAAFTIKLSAPSGQTVSVSAIPSNGTARAPADYTEGGVRLTFTPGQTAKVFVVPVKGDLLDEVNETFFVVLSSPVNAAIGVGRGTGTINDDDAPPSISIEDLGIGEGNAGQRIAALRLKLSAPSGQIVRVNAASANGTAVAGTTATSDYVALPTTQISFTVGNVFAYARVTINGDVLTEANETLKINLSSPINATITDTQGICTILNDDPAPSLTIDDVSIAEGNSGTNTLTFAVTLSKASGQTVTVNYATANGTARSDLVPSDYVAKSGALTFAAGQTSKTVNIVINGDTIVEGDETLFVLLSGSTNASVSKARGTGTITNDDASG